jgi:Tfp pilus assembly protein PilX
MMLARLRCERGIALATALAALAVTGVLSASFAAAAVRLSGTSDGSRDDKRALAAADAGLEAAVARLNATPTQVQNKCFTTAFVDPVGGVCPAQGPEEMGNGANFTYRVTPVLTTDGVCAGVPLTNASVATGGVNTVAQRCVTSVGVANGRTRRVQARVASYEGAPVFPKPGILGLNSVAAGNNVNIGGYIGTNGQVTLGTNAAVQTVELGPGAPNPIIGGGATIQQVYHRSQAEGNFVLAPIDFGNSASTNNNLRISSGLDTNSGPLSYTHATRDLSVGGSLTLGGGTYNFCRLTMNNNTQINVAAGARIRIFIDSPDRPGSGCIPAGMTAAQARAAGYGSMSLGNAAVFSNTNREDSLQIYIYGWNDGTQTIQFNNTAVLKAAIYAPQTTIVFNNSAQLYGGIVAGGIDFRNGGTFTWGAALSELRGDMVAHYVRTAWTECRRQPTVATDPRSGCSSN